MIDVAVLRYMKMVLGESCSLDLLLFLFFNSSLLRSPLWAELVSEANCLAEQSEVPFCSINSDFLSPSLACAVRALLFSFYY